MNDLLISGIKEIIGNVTYLHTNHKILVEVINENKFICNLENRVFVSLK